MSVKVIQITIPSENILPDIINSFSPEENYQMLKIGCETLNEGRKSIANLTSNQIFKKVESEFKKEIDKLNMDIVIEKNTAISINEKMIKMYETQIEKLNKKVENALSELEVYKQGNSTSFNEEINRIKEKYDLLLKEKDRQNQLNREIFDKAEKLINKTNKSEIYYNHLYLNLKKPSKQILHYHLLLNLILFLLFLFSEHNLNNFLNLPKY